MKHFLMLLGISFLFVACSKDNQEVLPAQGFVIAPASSVDNANGNDGNDMPATPKESNPNVTSKKSFNKSANPELK